MKHFFTLIFVFSFFCGYSEISTIHSFNEVNLDNLSSKSLVIFDIDEVIITPKDMLMAPAGWNYNSPLWSKIKDRDNNELYSIIVATMEYDLVDHRIPFLLADLTAKSIPTIALTGCSTGKLGIIPALELWRINHLSNLGIGFNFFYKEDCVFSFLSDDKEHPPIYKNGILFCGEFYLQKSSKGRLLIAFFDHINWQPDNVIFIDDQMKNLIAVEEELTNRGIPFKGFFFRSEHIFSEKVDEKIAEFQIQTLLEQKKWLSDSEAKDLLEEALNPR